MRKILIILSFFMMIVIAGCSIKKTPTSTPTPETPTNPGVQENTYTVTWKNYDGTVLEVDENVKAGETPTYDGQTPTKVSDAQYSYNFDSWGPAVTPVSKDVIYTAVFSSTVNTYTAVWKNHDGTVLETDFNIPYGTVPTYDGETPIKESTSSNIFNFIGWDQEVVAITSDVVYIAKFDSSDVTYTVTWKNHDGTVLETDTEVAYGATPIYNGAKPLKENTDQFTYEFKGWTPSISDVTSNVIYTAQFTETINKYTIIWKNYDGTVLETDSNVPYGTIPTYDGATPTKTGEGNYYFVGWTPVVESVKSDVTYIAQFAEMNDEYDVEGVTPKLSSDGKSILYGLYPQTNIKDNTLISILTNLQSTSINGWYFYDGSFYCQKVAHIYNGESYNFDNGDKIVEGQTYWFKCEPIEWNIIKTEDGYYSLVSKYLLDAQAYYEQYSNRTIDGNTVYANNYEQSDIRKWLNDDFYNTAFILNNVFIQTTTIDNSSATTNADENQYASANTQDKVYLLSYKDYLSAEYGFEISNGISAKREAKTTDYARANGAWINKTNTHKNSGSYWTRSSTSEYYYCAWNVNSGGYLSQYAVDGQSHCVRPSISIYYLNLE